MINNITCVIKAIKVNFYVVRASKNERNRERGETETYRHRDTQRQTDRKTDRKTEAKKCVRLRRKGGGGVEREEIIFSQ